VKQLIASWKNFFGRISYLPFVFVLIAISVYFWLNGAAHFPNWSSSYSDFMLIYIGMMLVFLFWSGKSTQEQLRTPVKMAVPTFVMFFVATYMILFALSLTGLMTQQTFTGSFWPMVILQVCVIATAEELMFRGVLLELTGVFLSSVLFALWHSYAYGVIYYDLSEAGVVAMTFAFLMGLLLAKITQQKKFGLPAAIGVHASYNLFVAGALYAL